MWPGHFDDFANAYCESDYCRQLEQYASFRGADLTRLIQWSDAVVDLELRDVQGSEVLSRRMVDLQALL